MHAPSLREFRIALYGILLDGPRVLMTRTRCPNGQTIMNFPGGKLELGEAPTVGLQREFVEETGVACEVGDVFHVSGKFFCNPFYPAEQLFFVYYFVTADIGSINLAGNGDDVESLRWIDLGSISTSDMLDADKEALTALRRHRCVDSVTG